MGGIRKLLTAAIAAGCIVLGAGEAYGARGVLRANCPEDYNWCAPSLSKDPDENCNDCCFETTEGQLPFGTCTAYHEAAGQWCFCFS